jgi:hypothetical protein
VALVSPRHPISIIDLEKYPLSSIFIKYHE